MKLWNCEGHLVVETNLNQAIQVSLVAARDVMPSEAIVVRRLDP